jgi:hypothetical protein
MLWEGEMEKEDAVLIIYGEIGYLYPRKIANKLANKDLTLSELTNRVANSRDYILTISTLEYCVFERKTASLESS